MTRLDQAIPTLQRAAREGRVLLTFDKDFGELARNATLPAVCGIVFFRTAMPRLGDVGASLVGLIEAHDDWAGTPFAAGLCNQSY